MFLLIGLAVSSRISKPLKKVTELVNVTSELDFVNNTSYDYLLKGKDETGEIARAVAILRDVIRNMAVNLNETSAIIEEKCKTG